MEKYKKTVNVKGNKIQRQGTIIKEIVIGSAKLVLEDEKSYALAGTVGLIQGLKYNGSLNRGIKAGVATISVMVGANIIRNIVGNIEQIKNA
jgi:exosortase/archaeosortase